MHLTNQFGTQYISRTQGFVTFCFELKAGRWQAIRQLKSIGSTEST